MQTNPPRVTESLLPQEIIRRKRDGAELSDDEINLIVGGLAFGSLTEAQVAAFAMAVFFRGMVRRERITFTQAMTRTGRILDWSDLDLDGPILDKHSTGGVGDKVSLILAPMVAAAGGYVPMISGRGLGHTGGTLDKLDSIPGYKTAPTITAFRKIVRKTGCAIIGQTGELAPGDRRLYGIRDVSATVESIPLIVASILSKKLAAGIDALVMDVKTGSGAFASELEQAEELAEAIVDVAKGAGLKTMALITDMNQILGRSAGNALEVREALDFLTGRACDPRLHEVTMALAVELLLLAGITKSSADAQSVLEKTLESGAAAQRFDNMVEASGGPRNLCETADDHLPQAPVIRAVNPKDAGIVEKIDTRAIGLAIINLGGGRLHQRDRIDYSVGLSEVAGVGEEVGKNHPLAIIHAADRKTAAQAANAVRAAFAVGNETPRPTPLIHKRIT
jgi:thymidine phosphorylase